MNELPKSLQPMQALFDSLNQGIPNGKEIPEAKAVFVVDNDTAAEWALTKVRESYDERDRLVKAAEGMISFYRTRIREINEKADNATRYLRQQLFEYFDSVDPRETKTMRKYELPSGSLVEKKATRKIQKGDETKLITWARENHPEFIVTKDVLKWADLKKTLTIDGDDVIVSHTGEIVPATIEACEAAFDIKF